MDAEVTCALWELEAAFVARTPRELLETAHGPGTTRVDEGAPCEVDPQSLAETRAWLLTVGLGLGGPDEVRALTPWMLREAVCGDRVDLHTALARIARFWTDWTLAERAAVRGLVHALWVSVLDRHPGAATPTTAVAFLDAAGGLGDDPERLLAIWEYKDIASADHHLAVLVVDAFHGARVHPAVLAWALAGPQRDRVRRALARDRAQPWASDLAAASALLPE